VEVYAPVVIQPAADVPGTRNAEEAIANLGNFLEAFPTCIRRSTSGSRMAIWWHHRGLCGCSARLAARHPTARRPGQLRQAATLDDIPNSP